METQRPSLPVLASARGALRPVLCLELCPPREGNWGAIAAVVNRSRSYQPDFLTMTDTGAARGRGSIEAAIFLKRTFGIPVIAHLACVGRSRDEFLRDASTLAEAGIRHVFVLRGDPPCGTVFTPHPDGFRYANEALEALRDRHFPFTMGAACYPSGHPEDRTPSQDLNTMVLKAAAGATFFVAQVGFDSSIDGYRKHDLAFADAYCKATSTLATPPPILPCHLAVSSVERLRKIGRRCGVTIPEDILRALARRGDRYLLRELTGFARSAWVQGAPGLHLSTFNDAEATTGFLQELFDQHIARRDNP